MAKPQTCTILLLTVVGALSSIDAWAADPVSTKALSSPTESTGAPRPCTGPWDFITTNCQLTWHGITVYGVVDAGFGWQSHGTPFDPLSAVSSSYLIQKQNRGPIWTLGANGLSNSFIGIKGTESIGGNFSVVFDLEAGFDPYSLRLSNGAGSIAASNGIPQNLQTSYSDSSRAGQFYNGQGYIGVSSPTYGTLTVFRQNSLTLDAVFDYDPFGASYAFSPIGFQGLACGGGNTQNCRHTTSLKCRINFLDHFRAAALWQFGGYGENNASNGAYQFGVGADIPTWGKDVLSFDAIYSQVRDSVALELAPGTNNAFGMPVAPFLPQALTATLSDNTALMFAAKYTTAPLKLYAGYEYIRYTAPSDPQTAFTDIAGNFLCAGCQVFNNTDINNAAYGVNGLGHKVLQIIWAGAKYAVRDDLDVIGAYYHYIQNSYFGTATGGPIFCSDSSHAQCAGSYDAISAAVVWRFAPKWDAYFGMMFNQVNGGLAFGFLQHNNIDPTVGVRFRF
jgi:predicted porin